ncbi:MAG: hypothetical protein ACTSUX_05970 [Promethearchaeota archaeon]
MADRQAKPNLPNWLQSILHAGQTLFNDGDYNASLLTTCIGIEYLINKLRREAIEEQIKNLEANALEKVSLARRAILNGINIDESTAQLALNILSRLIDQTSEEAIIININLKDLASILGLIIITLTF